MAKKTGKGLVALSSAAIVSVYGLGYAITQPAAVSMAAGTAPPAASAAPAQPAAHAQAASPAPSAQTAPAAASALKDGTYSGTGWSRHGSVTASITVKGGRIVSAPITGVTTRYSQSVIAGLPAEVVANQGSRVDLVSGATDSSTAYQSAVAQALAQAGGSPAPAASTTSSANSGAGVQVTGPNGGNIYRGGGRHSRGGYGYGD